MNYTPGPWAFKTKWCDQVVSDNGCICILTEYDGEGYPRTKLESRANARLIAASPKLLDSLKTLVEGMRASGINGPHLMAAEAAIKEAEGG